nr:MAG TPA: hypothetical protein [Caudoviricetes sp.]
MYLNMGRGFSLKKRESFLVWRRVFAQGCGVFARG